MTQSQYQHPSRSDRLRKRRSEEPAADATQYRSIVGALQYLTHTRPDIAFAVGVLGRYGQDPAARHWSLCKRLLRYLQGTKGLGLRYGEKGDNRILGYSDADWGGDTDDRKSTSGFAFFVNGALVSSKSKKQQTVALSTAEAEYLALSMAVQEAIWLQSLLHELGVHKVKSSALIMQDNQSTVAIATNPEAYDRTKRIDIRHHFVRDCVDSGLIQLQYCPSKQMVADILTKPLTQVRFEELRAKLGVCSNESAHK